MKALKDMTDSELQDLQIRLKNPITDEDFDNKRREIFLEDPPYRKLLERGIEAVESLITVTDTDWKKQQLEAQLNSLNSLKDKYEAGVDISPSNMNISLGSIIATLYIYEGLLEK